MSVNPAIGTPTEPGTEARPIRALIVMDFSEPAWLAHACAVSWASRARCELHYAQILTARPRAATDACVDLAPLRATNHMRELGSTIEHHAITGRPAHAV